MDSPRTPIRTLGLCGGTACGKGWFVEQVRAALPAGSLAVLSFDEWYRDLSHLGPAARAAQNFDHPDSLDAEGYEAALRALLRGDTTDVPDYDFATHSRRGSYSIDAAPIVIAEGILLLHFDGLRALLPERWYFDVPEDVRYARRLARDQRERGRTAAQVRAQYDASVAPMFRAFVEPSARWATRRLDGVAAMEAAVGPLVAELRAALTARGLAP